MDPFLITCALLLASILSVTNYFRRKNLPPTIFPTIPIIGHLYLLKKPLYKTLATLSAKHGPILLLRFGYRPVLLISSPSLTEECFTKNDIIFANRPNWLYGKIFGSNYTSLVWASYGNHWRNLRKMAAMEIFSSQRLKEFHEVRADEGSFLIRKLVSVCSSPVNLKTVFHELTWNVVTRMIAGKRYFGGGLEEEAQDFQDMVKERFNQGGASNLGDHFPILNWLGFKGPEKKMIALKNRENEFFQRLIDELRKENVGEVEKKNKKNTMIEVLFKLQENDPEYYTDEVIRSFVLTLLVAGTSTSATTMEWAFSLLLNHTDVLKKAQSEIDNHVGKHRLLEESDMTNLPYLLCIVNETLRKYPPAPLLVPHESSEPCVVGGYSIPRGTLLMVNQWSIQHDPNLWSDPERFDPGRFETPEGSTRHGYSFMPFGAGRRMCPGDTMAMRIIGLALGLLIQCFDWERISDDMVDMTEGFDGLTLPRAQPLLAKCQPRSMINTLTLI